MSRKYKEGVDRQQGELIPRRLDDYVSADNPVRAIDVYVDHQNLSAMAFKNTSCNSSDAGQPAYPPSGLLKLYLYGYLNQVRTSRKLERECRRNLEVMWLLNGLSPSAKTISDFRSTNSQALRRVHCEFIRLCKQLNLFSGDCVAVDGSFLKGSVSAKSFITEKGLRGDLKKIERHVREWEALLDQAEQESEVCLADDPELSKKLKAIDDMKADQRQKSQQLEQLKALKKSQHSTTDGDARLLNKGSQKVRGYNVQIVTDALHKLIVCDAVTTEPNDLQQLFPMGQGAKAVLGVERLSLLADAGYYSGKQIHECLEHGITPYVPEPGKPVVEGGRFDRTCFKYDANQDQYSCPNHQWLKRSGKPQVLNDTYYQRYTSSKKDCKHCSLRTECLTPKAQRKTLFRSEHETVMASHRQRMQAHPDKIRLRSALVEHPFGTLKRRAGWDHFLVRGKTKVTGEWSLMVLGYNFMRVLNIMGLEAFVEAVKNKRNYNRLMKASRGYIRTHFQRSINSLKIILVYHRPTEALG
jgi:transposase